MKKWMLVLTAVVALSGGTLMAVGISNLSGQSCGDQEGVWHFVNNQVSDASGASLTACYTGGCQTVGPSAVNNKTVHFVVVSSGALLSAASNLDGKLVLSDFTCSGGKEPPCDPKTQTCK